MYKKVLLINCLTNLHVGSGDEEVSIVDKCVQRDQITNFPVINGSSLKGALRHHFTVYNIDKNDINRYFGSDNGLKEDNLKEGKIKFLTAHMICFPMPDQSKCYKLGIVKKNLEDLNNFPGVEHATIKCLEAKYKDAYYIDDKDDIELPVIARNHLDNGISQNLWYEEVVPRKSSFVSILLSEEEKLLNDFTEALVNQDYIQIGANASVGMGYCKFEELK